MYPRVFDARTLGQSFKEVARELLPKGQIQIVSRWFHSAKECDLFIWTDKEDNILKQQLSFYGQVVEWNVVEGLKTGLVIEDERQDESMQGGSEIVRFDEKPQPTPVEQAMALLNHMTALNDLEKRALLGNFSDPGAGTNLPAEEFIRRFGSFLDQPKPSTVPEPGFSHWFKTVKNWFKR